MSRDRGLRIVLCALLVLPVGAGCGRRHGSQKAAEQKPAALPMRTTLRSPSVTLKDTKGEWKFDVVARTITTAGEDKPSDMTGRARHVPQGEGGAGAHEQRRHLRLDQVRQVVTLEGNVVLISGGIREKGSTCGTT